MLSLATTQQTQSQNTTTVNHYVLEERFHEGQHDSDEVGRMENIHLLDVLLVPEHIILHNTQTIDFTHIILICPISVKNNMLGGTAIVPTHTVQ